MSRHSLGAASLAIAALTVALALAPSPARAENGPSVGGYCLVTDKTGTVIGAVAEGEEYRETDKSNPKAIQTTVYRCKKTLFEGESSAGVVALSLVYEYSYCYGVRCYGAPDDDDGGYTPVLT